ncbi:MULTISPECIES: hypothetical protein [Sphingobium]|uniref:hypothetical protein n=1 Tax=Sphingobium sp. MI1205 TaxID=407020 RepID=UPI0007702436|nr:hypothetical protein [Sphingobium sp. MI1205]AMK18572.1 hypothetical protein K663_10965 [Sphingobium sp. MI1205]
MLKGNWRVGAALAGLILAGANAPPKQVEQPKQAAIQSELSKAVASESTPISSVRIPNDRDTGCSKGEDKRESDLCAQWKAADAAREAAEYAWYTMLLGFVGTIIGFAGTLLLVFTFFETRKTARAELRAYVAVDMDGMEINGRTGAAEVKLKICNQGQTPAFKSVWAGNVVISTPEQLERDLAVTPRKQPEMGRRVPATVNGHQTASGSFFNHVPFTVEEMKAAVSGEKSLFVFGFVWYEDAFGKKRETVFCYQSAPLPPPNISGKPIAQEGQWSQTHFFNDAT